MNDGAPVIAANLASIVLVSAIVVMKVARRIAGSVRRRLRIAIDMDEVMADALAEHVRRYNLAFGAQLTIADLHGRSLEDARAGRTSRAGRGAARRVVLPGPGGDGRLPGCHPRASPSGTTCSS